MFIALMVIAVLAIWPVSSEVEDDYMQREPAVTPRSAPPVMFGPFISRQVNIDSTGRDDPFDAANEPSLAIDPRHPQRMVIAWRQFDNVRSSFRQAGWAYSHDGGRSWTAATLDPRVSRSDPGVVADRHGHFYLCCLRADFVCEVFKSLDGGMTWGPPVVAGTGDKPWMIAGRGLAPGQDHLYIATLEPSSSFSRSIDGGRVFQLPSAYPRSFSTACVDQYGVLYAIAGFSARIYRSRSARDHRRVPEFDFMGRFDLGGNGIGFTGPNPGGLLAQPWLATSPSGDALYVLHCVQDSSFDPLDLKFARSGDGGASWTGMQRLNDDRQAPAAWQWFSVMAVAPNGRIDVVWNDTRGSLTANLGQLYYIYSPDSGRTWSRNIAVGPQWDSHIGWPNQRKIGDYYDIHSDDRAAHVAYSATYRGGQDVYYLRIGVPDTDGDSDVDLADFARIQQRFGRSTEPLIDLDRDGDVDLLDHRGVATLLVGPHGAHHESPHRARAR